jgi:hypothetical protein
VSPVKAYHEEEEVKNHPSKVPEVRLDDGMKGPSVKQPSASQGGQQEYLQGVQGSIGSNNSSGGKEPST